MLERRYIVVKIFIVVKINNKNTTQEIEEEQQSKPKESPRKGLMKIKAEWKELEI